MQPAKHTIPFSIKYASIFLPISWLNFLEISGSTSRLAPFHPGPTLWRCCMFIWPTVFRSMTWPIRFVITRAF